MMRLLFLLAATALLAQEPAPAPARAAAEQWLPLVDSAKFGESWDQASENLRKAVSREQWEQSLKHTLKPFGKFKARSLETAKFLKDPPQAPAGDYYLLQY